MKEYIPEKSKSVDYQIPAPKKNRVTANSEISGSSSHTGTTAHPTTLGDHNNIQSNIHLLKLDIDEWGKNEKNVRLALTLLPE